MKNLSKYFLAIVISIASTAAQAAFLDVLTFEDNKASQKIFDVIDSFVADVYCKDQESNLWFNVGPTLFISKFKAISEARRGLNPRTGITDGKSLSQIAIKSSELNQPRPSNLGTYSLKIVFEARELPLCLGVIELKQQSRFIQFLRPLN